MKKQKQKSLKRLRTLFSSPQEGLSNFSSLDYLNLASHPYIKEMAVAYATKWGTGFLPTRFVASYEKTLKTTEERFAKLLGFEAITFYESDPILTSEIHASLKSPLRPSIFVETGEIVPFEKTFPGEFLAIDDSLTFSVLGDNGFGLATHLVEADLILGHFPKQYGSYVSFLASSKQLKTELFEKIPKLHREQYIPPLFLGMIDASLQMVPSLHAERKNLFALKQLLHQTFKKIGFALPLTKAPFVTLRFSNKLELKSFHTHLTDYGYIAKMTPSALIFFPNLALCEKKIHALSTLFSTYKELPFVEAL